MDKLYNYIFHHNHHTGLWAAIPRDKASHYFNNMNERVNNGILFSNSLPDLMDFINRKQSE